MVLPTFTHHLTPFAIAITGLTLSLVLSSHGVAAEVPDFNREVRPILARHCLRCHGQDEKQRKGDLRLDLREAAIEAKAIQPGNLSGSTLWERVLSDDPEEVMPPPKEKRPLSVADKDVLKRWIEGGAPYAGHWAFQPPERPAVPTTPESQAWSRQPLDHFIHATLSKHGMKPTTEASREEWLRRVTEDLTGLPPSLAEIDAFLADSQDGAYQRVVDRLLSSSRYGERMAADWLDVARYADTYGRHEDGDCITWPYRDWVIRAFNQNLPYDQFITWQTAGDLLPNPTQDQMIATCFNRLPQQSNEAGSNPEEFRIEQVADRIRTNGLAFLGLTLECARCHDHKFDPISMRDYYSMAAMLNNIDEMGLFCVYTGGVPPPSILLLPPEKEARMQELKTLTASLEDQQKNLRLQAQPRFAAWLKDHRPPVTRGEGFFGAVARAVSMPPMALPTRPLVHVPFDAITEKKEFLNLATGHLDSVARLRPKLRPGRFGQGVEFKQDNAVFVNGVADTHRHDPFSFGLWIFSESPNKRATLAHRSRSGIDSASRGFEIVLQDDKPEFALCHFSPGNEIRIRASETVPTQQWVHIAATYDGSSKASGMRLYVNGALSKHEVVRDNLYRDIVYRADWGDDPGGKDAVEETGLVIGGRRNDGSFKDGIVDDFFFYDREISAAEVRQWARLDLPENDQDWFDWYLREVDQPWRDHLKKLQAARAEENDLSGQAVDLMVMKEWTGPRRPTHILNRGQFDQPKEEVTPATPASLPPMPAGAPANRLGLAQWMVSPTHPLVSRVAVNRLWQMCFGRGIVLTAEDFGTQGQPPSHPELLDWLATHFMDGGWNTKGLLREFVLSATYRQSSIPANAADWKDDPDNRLLGRGPRRRLSAEQIRDLALFASGWLNPAIGGPSVKPYQPARLWEESGTQHIYSQDHGEKLYRRSLYTFWRRTMPPPSMTLFDAPTREFCKLRRERTATPLQALVLMNDPQFIEASRGLAENLVKSYPNDDVERARYAYRLLTSRQPSPNDLEVVAACLRDEREEFRAQPDKAKNLLSSSGEHAADGSIDSIDVAATTMMVRMLFDFSETTMTP
ncbi:MAG: DUF1553 domain-containing protein [Verrucomicrobiaceae bacterium]|nr:DUF1553 domain-containing protein [Verrucomicrobiaceae bacterium]